MTHPALLLHLALAMVPLALAKDPPLFLKPFLPFEDYTTVRITYTHTVPAVAGPPVVASYDITRKRDVPFCPRFIRQGVPPSCH